MGDGEPVRTVGQAAPERVGLRVRLAACTFLVCLTVVAMFALNVLHERTVASDVARREAQNLAHWLAQYAADTFEAADVVLAGIAERVSADGTRLPARDRLRRSIDAQIAVMPRLRAVVVLTANGETLVASDRSARLPPAIVAAVLRDARNHPDERMRLIGPLVISGGAGPLIIVGRSIRAAGGAPAALALAEIPVAAFESAFARVDVGPHGVMGLATSAGIVLARRPERFIGRSVAYAPMFGLPYRALPTGSYVSASRIDAVTRLFVFRRLAAYPVVADVAVAPGDYLAGWAGDARNHAVALVFVLALVIVFAGGLDMQIRQRQRAEDSLAALALVDGLTGIANRRQFDDVLVRELRHGERDGTALTLLMIDTDHFKSYNDRFGHQHGDRLLNRIAGTIAASIFRPSDMAARYGGDEFAVILPATDAPSGAAIAERIRSAVARLTLPPTGDDDGRPSVSIGVASVVPADVRARDLLIAAADKALYDAKRLGRNRVAVAAEPVSLQIRP